MRPPIALRLPKLQSRNSAGLFDMKKLLLKLLIAGAAAMPVLLDGGAASAAPRVSTLVQYQGSVWGMVGNIVSWRGGLIGGASSSSTVNLISPPAIGQPWQSTPLHVFPSFSGDGAFPAGGVIASALNVFGTTSGGGSTACANGCGTVFQLTPPATDSGAWTETQLITFNADNNGYGAYGTLAAMPAGGRTQLVGTTIHAANDTVHPNTSAGAVGGVVFLLAPPVSGSGPWTETVLHHFDAANSDGDTPFGSLTVGPDKSIYGTTFTGGRCNQGTVYRLAPPATKNGKWTETLLHEFGATTPDSCDYNDGNLPVAGVTLVGNQLYGTTRGGTSAECGTAYVITLGNPVTYRKIYTFGQPSGDACSPQAALRVDAGIVYGTAVLGGGAPASTECPNGCGAIFKLTPQPDPTPYTATVLYGFTGKKDGSQPSTNLLVNNTGALLGATKSGGFTTDVAEPDYASFGTAFRFTR